MDDDMEMFLRRRSVKDEIIAKMKRDKIDRFVVQCDAQVLSKYLEVGDQIALKHFCEDKSTSTETATKRKKDSILKKLRQKISLPGQAKYSDDSDEGTTKKGKQVHSHLVGNAHARKKTRIVEIGWIHFKKQDNMYHQVRAKNGGMTRKQEVQKDAVKKDILALAKDKFFKNEKSRLGKWTDFETDILDFEENSLPENETVGEMYEKTGIKRLRFYLATKTRAFVKNLPNFNCEETNMEQFAPNYAKLSSHDSKCLSLLESSVPPTKIFDDSSSSDLPDADLSNASEIIQFKGDFSRHSEEDDTNLTLPYTGSDILAIATASAGITFEDTYGTLETCVIKNTKDMREIPTHSFSIEDVNILQGDRDTAHSPVIGSPRPPTPPMSENERTVRLLRIRIEHDMINNFIDPSILTENIKFQFIDEKGVDASGVSREAYGTFWEEFLKNSSKGEQERIPLIKPSMQKPEWEAVGRILAKGFKDVDFYPIKLSKAFTIAIIFGEEEVTSDDLLDSLFGYVAPIEKDALKKAINNNLDDEEDMEEYVDVLTRLGSKHIPTGDQVKPVILKIAQKELIQTTKYAMDSISPVARQILRSKLNTSQSVREMYLEKEPSNRKVMKLFEAQEMGMDQDRCFGYLKQYVKALDYNALRQFLRHVTGADMICVKKIEVHFNNRYGLNRIPVVRTCTPMIELSITYTDYPDFRAEFDDLLRVHHPLDID